ncbi:hypothetical protein BIY24_07720 [Halobacteriovorax marinus]|uniref:hypothetical protein n=1 Tax=Halobacteriovorax marinus TaxID=97084 RepID=UPI000BC2FFBC|nr:hypothetical protein [Halobacteriovorax marinus]ATH07840.1 hypothetical protein BIY24_07720 [Halobacteriovorax marinus]
MKRIATLICLTGILASPFTSAREKELIAWKVTSVGNEVITNYDVDQFIEHTQISDSLKTILFKRANKNYSEYQKLKSEIAKKNFNKSAGQLIYAHIMQKDHQRKHGSKRVAFKVTEDTFYKAIQDNETKVLRHLLDTGIGIVKSREQFGEFLISQAYPHQSGESATEVYWRWYEDQKSRIKTELFLKEVKNYEAYIALRNQKYYHTDYLALNDRYKDLRAQVAKNIENKKLTHQALYTLLNQNSDWKIVVKEISNTQIDSSPVGNIKKDFPLQNRADEILHNITEKNWQRATSYHKKSEEILKKNLTTEQLNDLAKKYTEIYIKDKSNFASYMSALIAKLAAKTKESSLEKSISEMAKEINDSLREETIKFKNQIIASSDSKEVLSEALETHLMSALDYEKLNEVEKALVELSVFSIKFQIRKQAFESTLPVRVEFAEYTDFKTNDALRNLLKHEWMQKEFKSYVQDELLYNTEYMTIRMGKHEYLTPEEKVELIFGKDFRR